jgi:hypothetical protein
VLSLGDKPIVFKCPTCKKVMRSFYPAQMEQWKAVHLATHDAAKVSVDGKQQKVQP